jgi:hypothetical protein
MRRAYVPELVAGAEVNGPAHGVDVVGALAMNRQVTRSPRWTLTVGTQRSRTNQLSPTRTDRRAAEAVAANPAATTVTIAIAHNARRITGLDMGATRGASRHHAARSGAAWMARFEGRPACSWRARCEVPGQPHVGHLALGAIAMPAEQPCAEHGEAPNGSRYTKAMSTRSRPRAQTWRRPRGADAEGTDPR